MSLSNNHEEFAASVLLPIRHEGKWGYVDVEGRIVVQPKYQSTGKCFEGGPYAIQDNTIIFLSCGDNVVTSLEDAWAMQSISSGLLAFDRKFKTGFCDSKGLVVIVPQFLNATPFIAGGSSVCVEIDGRRSVHRVGVEGERFNEFDFGLIRPFLHGERLAGAKLLQSDVYVVIDGSGRPVDNNQFADVRSGSEGLIPVRFLDGLNKMGWVDDDLNIVVPQKFDDLGDYFSGDTIPACQTGLWGLVGRDGEWIVRPKFSFIANGGLDFWPTAVSEAFVGDLGKLTNSAMTLINREGEILTNERFADVVMYNQNIAQCYWPRSSNASVRDPVPFAYLSSKGEVIWSEKYSN